MLLVVALGNPGSEYKNTRHNVGFMLVDAFAAAKGLTFGMKSKFSTEVAEYIASGQKVIFIKPTTFYNESGAAARAVSDFYKILPEDILIIHDDLMLPIGTLRTRKGGRDAGNNGVKSINSHIGEETLRLRVGTWTEHRETIDDTTFVLSAFNPDEQTKISEMTPKVIEIIDSFIAGSLETTTHR